MTEDKEARNNLDKDKLLRDLELLMEEALRGVVCPPDFKTEGSINKAYNNLRDYILNQNSGQEDGRTI